MNRVDCDMTLAGILYLYLKSPIPTNIKAEQDSSLDESVPSFTLVKYWVAEFKRGRTSCQDEHGSGQGDDSRNGGVPGLLTLEQKKCRVMDNSAWSLKTHIVDELFEEEDIYYSYWPQRSPNLSLI
ncbi:hypothetical protein TNCV_2234461 [Trichonephila clavipes]|nr:hypothetical protein TNCV_2234461 [Trichonephila clavipes]